MKALNKKDYIVYPDILVLEKGKIYEIETYSKKRKNRSKYCVVTSSLDLPANRNWLQHIMYEKKRFIILSDKLNNIKLL
jgi:hypothetical protein